MIEYVKGDILKANVEALVNPVNCVGVVGAGLSLQFKKAFPDNFRSYAESCRGGGMQMGEVLVNIIKISGRQSRIINFPTKRHWRDKSRLEDIDDGLWSMLGAISVLGINSVAIPPLGCGLGGLRWEDVRLQIEQVMQCLDGVDVLVYRPLEASA